MMYTQFTLDVTVEHDPQITIEEIIKGIWALVGTTIVERDSQIGSAQPTHAAVVDEVRHVSCNTLKAGDRNGANGGQPAGTRLSGQIGVHIADVLVPEGKEFAGELSEEGILQWAVEPR